MWWLYFIQENFLLRYSFLELSLLFPPTVEIYSHNLPMASHLSPLVI